MFDQPERTCKEGHFAWQDKRVLARICRECEDAASAQAVYVAMTIIASDARTETFTTTHAWIAKQSGVSERTVRSRVPDLERIGVVAVIKPKIRAPFTYRLLPFGDGCRTSGDGCRTFGNETTPTRVTPLPPLEEGRRKTKESAPAVRVAVTPAAPDKVAGTKRGADHARLIAEWTEVYRMQFGDEYPFQKRDVVAVKTLLGADRSVEEILKVATAAWSGLRTPFLKSQALTLHGLANNWGAVREEVNGRGGPAHAGAVSATTPPQGPARDLHAQMREVMG